MYEARQTKYSYIDKSAEDYYKFLYFLMIINLESISFLILSKP